MSDRHASGALGLIAGEGSLPVRGARRARQTGQRLVCVAIRDLADPVLDELADEILWIHPGEVVRGIGFLREQSVNRAVLAGKVMKQGLVAQPGSLAMDPATRALVADLPDLGDVTLLRGLAELLQASGIELLPQWSLDPELRVGPGPLGRHSPSASQQRDIDFGLPIARAIAALDVGQSLVVKQGAVLAVEAMEGTDAALLRGGALAAGAVAIKVARPEQDPRFDVPAIGPRTVATLARARIAALAFQADATLVLERSAVVRDADAAGIAIVGVVPPEGS